MLTAKLTGSYEQKHIVKLLVEIECVCVCVIMRERER